MSRRLIVVLLILAAPACSGIGVRDVKRPALFADWRASALAADRPSPRTVQTLRIYALDDAYDRNPDDGIRRLHATAVADPQPDTIFALAELSYLRGQVVARKRPDEAARHYVRCCAYAQHYLLASSVDGSPGADAPGSPSSTPLTPRDAFDPRFRLACNL